MEEGPSGSAIRSLIPSHHKLLRSKTVVVSSRRPGHIALVFRVARRRGALWAWSSEAKLPDALERERHAGDDAPARLWLDAIRIVKDRNSNSEVARPLVVREAKTGREVDAVAAGVLIHDEPWPLVRCEDLPSRLR